MSDETLSTTLHPLLHPPPCLSFMAVFLGVVSTRKAKRVFVRVCVFFLQKMSAGSPARHEKARITKDLHICQRFGAEGERGGRWRGRGHFITFSKVQKLNIGLFWRTLPKFSTESRRVLTALRRRPLFRSALRYRRRQLGAAEVGWIGHVGRYEGAEPRT